MRDRYSPPSPTLCHPVPLAHLRKIEVTEICHLMQFRYLRLNSFTSNGLSFFIFLFLQCFGNQFIIQANKMLIISLSFRLTNIFSLP